MKKIFIISAALLAGIVGCKKIREGFLSDQVRYRDNVINCKRGLILVQSDRINADGSTPPFTYKLKNLRDKATGKPAPAEFDTEYEVLVFKDGLSFNIDTDSTVAILNTKRELKKLKPMIFNEVSGQLIFNKATANLPLGEYLFDVDITNVYGTKSFPSIAQINVLDPEGDDLFTIYGLGAAYFFDATGANVGMKNPKITCTKQSNDGARVILKIVDKNGVPFNPKTGEVLQRGDRPRFENYAKFNPVITTDTAMICDFEVAPFPLAKYVTPATDWGHLMYYRIPSTAVAVDGVTPGTVSANPRFDFQVKLEGTYIVEVRLTDATHR